MSKIALLSSSYSTTKAWLGVIVPFLMSRKNFLQPRPLFPLLPLFPFPLCLLGWYIWWAWLLCFSYSKCLVAGDSSSNLIWLFWFLLIIVQFCSVIFSQILHLIWYSEIVRAPCMVFRNCSIFRKVKLFKSCNDFYSRLASMRWRVGWRKKCSRW